MSKNLYIPVILALSITSITQSTCPTNGLDELETNSSVPQTIGSLTSMVQELTTLLEQQKEQEALVITPEIANLLVAMITTIIQEAEEPRRKPQQQASQNTPDDDDRSTEVVLTTFANVVSHFANILVAPKDPVVVKNSIAGMLAGMFVIAKQGTRSKLAKTPN